MFLNCHSYHSLRYGTISIKELVEQAVHFNIKTLALTDINTITGIYDFYKLCQDHHIKPIVGVEIWVQDELYYICLARNQKSIAEVNRLLTAYNCDGIEISKANPDFKDTFVIYPLENIPEQLSDHEFIGIRQNQLNLLIKPEIKPFIHKMVILHPVTFTTPEEYELHKILRAIDHNTLISKLTETDYCQDNEMFTDKKELLAQFYHQSQIIENTKYIINNCHFDFDFDFSTPKNKKYFTDSKENDFELLKKLAYQGLSKRYSDVRRAYHQLFCTRNAS